MMRYLSLKAYGKVNLALDVLRRREDGYHEVRMVMQTVGLYDKIDLFWREKPGITVETNLYYLPVNENNLVYKAAALLMQEFGVEQGVHIRLKKFIPVAAGMAGGSSDAAAVLYGVNRMFGLGLSPEQLQQRGAKLGADVPYCVLRGTVLCEGIGEILTPLPPMPQCQILIAKPAVGVSTKNVYEKLRADELTAEQHPDVDGMVEAIRRQDIMTVAAKMGNVLESVTVPEHPEIAEIRQLMLDWGAVNAMMSGSGPTVFGLFTNPRMADAAYEKMRYGAGSQLARQVYLTNLFNRKTTKQEYIRQIR